MDRATKPFQWSLQVKPRQARRKRTRKSRITTSVREALTFRRLCRSPPNRSNARFLGSCQLTFSSFWTAAFTWLNAPIVPASVRLLHTTETSDLNPTTVAKHAHSQHNHDGQTVHRSVICEYENNNRADGCFAGILPESGLRGKRTRWARQYHKPWEGTCALSLQDLREDV